MKIPLSIVIPTKNEALNLALCLDSIKPFEDVVIVDSGSTDATPEIARKYGRKLIEFKWNGKFPKKRNWVLRNYKFIHPWVLFLDADERITAPFVTEVLRVLPETSHQAFWISYQNWFLGRMLRHGDPMRKTALLRIGYGAYENIPEDHWSNLDMEIHEQLVVNGSVGKIDAKLEHYDKRNLVAYYQRHIEYSTWEAQRYLALKDKSCLTARQKIKYQMLCCPFFPPMYFIISYFAKAGFLDGWSGFYFAVSKMFYFYQIQANIFALRKTNTQGNRF